MYLAARRTIALSSLIALLLEANYSLCGKLPRRSLDAVTFRADCRITAKELKEKNTQLLQQVSVRTIQRRLKDDLYYEHRAPQRKPTLTENQRHKRVQFCRKYLKWDNEKWEKVLWNDEAKFYVTEN